MKFGLIKSVRFLSQWHLKLIIGAILFLQFSAPSYAADVTLAWDASTSENIIGYKVYYRKGRRGPPYNGKGANEGDSPVDVGNVTTYTLTSLSDTERYYFVVSAYDSSKRESGYSNWVCANCRAEAKSKPTKEVKPPLIELSVVAPVKLPSGSVIELSRGQVEIIKKQPGVFFGAKVADMLGPGEVVLTLPDDLGGGFIYGKPEFLARAFSTAGATKGSVPATHLFQDRGSCLFF